MNVRKLFVVGCVAFCTLTTQAQIYFGSKKVVPDSIFNSLAQTPPMGWNSWNKFGCNVSEKLLM